MASRAIRPRTGGPRSCILRAEDFVLSLSRLVELTQPPEGYTNAMRYRRFFSTEALARVFASFQLVPQVVGNRLSGRHPVATDLACLDSTAAHEVSEMPCAEPELGSCLGQGDQLLVRYGLLAS